MLMDSIVLGLGDFSERSESCWTRASLTSAWLRQWLSVLIGAGFSPQRYLRRAVAVATRQAGNGVIGSPRT